MRAGEGYGKGLDEVGIVDSDVLGRGRSSCCVNGHVSVAVAVNAHVNVNVGTTPACVPSFRRAGRDMAAGKEIAAPANCPRCARALPPGAAKVCVFCGTPLTVTPTRNPNLGFGPRPLRDPLVGPVGAGRFKVEELIGQGGMGKVYRARHLALDRLTCLKMLKPAL